MSTLIYAPIDAVRASPFRRLDDYPYDAARLDALTESMRNTGFWEGIIARPAGNCFEIAFGHHRLEAARRLELPRAPLIVRDLTDQQMLGMMGRENLEAYNTDFRALLEAWEAATRFLTTDRIPTAIETARLLGWANPAAGRAKGKDPDQLNNAARACDIAARLVASRWAKRKLFARLTVSEALAIVSTVQGHFDDIDMAAEEAKRPQATVGYAKAAVMLAATFTADSLRDDTLPRNQIAKTIHASARAAANVPSKEKPTFAKHLRSLIRRVDKLFTDHTKFGSQLLAARDAVGQITLDMDRQAAADLAIACDRLARRAEGFAVTLRATPNVIRLESRK